MTKLSVNVTHSTFLRQSDRPRGFIASLDDIRHREWPVDSTGRYKDRSIYTVTQSGYINRYLYEGEFHAARFIFDGSATSTLSEAFLYLKKENSYDESGYSLEALYLESHGIRLNGPIKETDTSPQFQAFFYKDAAEEYSNYLKNNDEYIASVEAWHAKCRDMFDGL